MPTIISPPPPPVTSVAPIPAFASMPAPAPFPTHPHPHQNQNQNKNLFDLSWRTCPHNSCPLNWIGLSSELIAHLVSSTTCRQAFFSKVTPPASVPPPGSRCGSMEEIKTMVKKGGLGKSMAQKRKIICAERFRKTTEARRANRISADRLAQSAGIPTSTQVWLSALRRKKAGLEKRLAARKAKLNSMEERELAQEAIVLAPQAAPAPVPVIRPILNSVRIEAVPPEKVIDGLSSLEPESLPPPSPAPAPAPAPSLPARPPLPPSPETIISFWGLPTKKESARIEYLAQKRAETKDGYRTNLCLAVIESPFRPAPAPAANPETFSRGDTSAVATRFRRLPTVSNRLEDEV